MLNVTRKIHDARAATERLVLPFELRQKSRLRTHLASGAEVGLFLERGTVLRGGDLLQAEEGTIIEVVAADETVSTVTSNDASQLARAGYHLGNRHVAVQIGAGWLRYRHDHVLDDMVRGLGLPVTVEQAPFEPEGGAYGYGHAHASGHAAAPFAPHHSHTHTAESPAPGYSRTHAAESPAPGYSHTHAAESLAPGYSHTQAVEPLAPGHLQTHAAGLATQVDSSETSSEVAPARGTKQPHAHD
jgi:urease accessory protein